MEPTNLKNFLIQFFFFYYYQNLLKINFIQTKRGLNVVQQYFKDS